MGIAGCNSASLSPVLHSCCLLLPLLLARMFSLALRSRVRPPPWRIPVSSLPVCPPPGPPVLGTGLSAADGDSAMSRRQMTSSPTASSAAGPASFPEVVRLSSSAGAAVTGAGRPSRSNQRLLKRPRRFESPPRQVPQCSVECF